MSKLIRHLLLMNSGAPAISVSPSSWDFGATPVGSPVSKIFTIENTGTRTLEITLPITIVGDDADAFTVTVQPDASVGAGLSTTFTIQADADVVDSFAAEIEIVSNAAGSPTLVAIEAEITQTYENYMLTVVQPRLWMKHQEVSGTTITDSSGNGHDGTLTLGAGSLGEDGFDAVDEAILADGSTTKIAIASSAALKNASMFFGFLCKPTGAGEGSAGAFANYSDAGDTAMRFNLGSNVLAMSVGGTGTGVTTTSAVGITPSINEWQWLFFGLESATKKCRIWKGRLGTLTEFTYASQTAWTGTQNGAAILTLLNNAAQSRSFAGLMDESFAVMIEPDTAMMQQLIDLKGV